MREKGIYKHNEKTRIKMKESAKHRRPQTITKIINCKICHKEILKVTNTSFCKNCAKLSLDNWYKEYKHNPSVVKKHRESMKKYNKNNSHIKQLTNRRYELSNPQIVHAQRLAHKIKLGSNCEICGSNNHLERHHWRYDKPLEISTLCHFCHTAQHKYITEVV